MHTPEPEKPTELGDPEITTDLLDLIREQLSPSEAAELTFYADDDPTMFCAIALAKIQRGTLVVPVNVKRALHRRLSGEVSPSPPGSR